MNRLTHTSAKPSHYNKEAEHYDAFNEKASQASNAVIENILKKYRVKTVLDMTCGTGSQVFWLAKKGYQVTGSDINAKMLKVATEKIKQNQLPVKLLKGDVRTLQAGEFDAIITIFNAVGHLTKADFEKAMQNIHRNLKPGGLYIFDIFNLNYLLKDNNITQLTIDWQAVENQRKIREIQYSTIDYEGILASYTLLYSQEKSHPPKLSKTKQTLQVYTAAQLKDMLHRNGFKVLKQCSIDGSRFYEYRTERLLLIARKI